MFCDELLENVFGGVKLVFHPLEFARIANEINCVRRHPLCLFEVIDIDFFDVVGLYWGHADTMLDH